MNKVMEFTVGRDEYVKILKEEFRQAAMNNECESMDNIQDKLEDIMKEEEYEIWTWEDEYDDNGDKICLRDWTNR